MENVIIIGTGCASHTAAIYTARANLNPLMILSLGKRLGCLQTQTGAKSP